MLVALTSGSVAALALGLLLYPLLLSQLGTHFSWKASVTFSLIWWAGVVAAALTLD